MTSCRAKKLSDREIEQSVRECLDNATELRAAASVLNRHGIAGVAMAISRIRIEELAKASLLLRMRDTEASKRDWPAFWKIFNDHESKWVEQLQRWAEGRDLSFAEVAARRLVRDLRAASGNNRGL